MDLTALIGNGSFSNGCNFDKLATPLTLTFDAGVIIAAIGGLVLLSKYKKNIFLRYMIVCGGIFIFEFFTSPMWNNWHLGRFAYVYQDVSWILTAGWGILILGAVTLVDHYFKKYRAGERFAVYLFFLTAAVFILEVLIVQMGIRSYAPEVLHTAVGVFAAGVPIEVFYFVPVFLSLVIGFYKYWEFVIDDEILLPIKKRKFVRNFCLAFIGVLLFELMVEPLVTNTNFPAWSYIYRDISLLNTGVWILVLWISTNIIDYFFVHWSLSQRFLAYLFLIDLCILPFESWLIHNGYRVYGPSTVANFTGFVTPITNVPIEIVFAIPLYMALVLAFVRYWEIIIDNRK